MGNAMTEQIWKLDATAQADLVRRGEVTSRELVLAAIERAEALRETVNPVAWLDGVETLERAEPGKTGPFVGVPVLLKDLLPQPGMPCAFGSRLFSALGFIPTDALPYTRAVQASGVVPIGKSTTSEFGLLGSTESAVAGTTRNPWSLLHSAGGSSGGAAAAVACGIVPLAHASDGGGSVRIPAALCGLFGFKPSRDRCVSAHASPNAFTGLIADHCVTRSVRDSATWLACTQRADAAAPYPAIDPRLSPPPRPLRIGVFTSTLMGAPAPAAGSAALDTAVALCRELGHHVEVAAPPDGLGLIISEAFFTVAGAAMHDLETTMTGMLGRAVADDELEPFTWSLIHRFRTLPSDIRQRTRLQLDEVAARHLQFQRQWDITLCPTLGIATPTLGFLSPDRPREQLIARTEQLAGYTPVHNIAGTPAMSVPMGHDPDGMPVGCHFAAMPGDDAVLLGLAAQLEHAAPWAHRWPALVS